MSAFLQERLQKERQYEQSQKAAGSPSSNTGSNGHAINRDDQSSPCKGASTNRPPSSNEESGPKGHGVKQMEQVISGLHKQNFDLKLELYHRRERQSALEDRIEALEADHAKVQHINDDLISELEKRDKAIEEAVAMIVTLEAKLEEYATREREMVQKIESDHGFRIPDFRGHQEDAERELQRMPSFVSDWTEDTEHLRHCFLKQRSSMNSMPRGASGAYEPGLASPNLSVLSESSFVSVYGQKNSSYDETTIVQSPNSSMLEGQHPSPGRPVTRNATPQGKPLSAKRVPSTSSSRSNFGGQYPSDSPLQKLEKLDRGYAKRPQSSGRDMSALNSAKKLSQAPPHPRTKSEQRGSLRHVSTESQGGARIHDPNLPPTPDTMSSATLHGVRRSNDTLDVQTTAAKADVPPVPKDAGKTAPRAGTQPLRQPGPKSQDFDRDAFLRAAAHLQRPRSADETTISKRGGDWDSDSEAGGSLRSSMDIWLPGDGKGPADRSRSPDLFGFPTTASRGGWPADTMFAPGDVRREGGARIDGDNGVINEMLTMHHALFSSVPNGPPPPNRRSSLHATTGSGAPTPAAADSPARGEKRIARKKDHARADSAEVNSRTLSLTSKHEKAEEQEGQAQEKKYYPPLSGQAARAGFSRIFRRSLVGNSETAPQPPEHKTQPAVQPPERAATAMGMPSGVSSGVVAEDEFASATPPPIMRNPRVGRARSVTEYDCERDRPMDDAAAGMPLQDCRDDGKERRTSLLAEGHESKGGKGRKWLHGFGRAASLKSRTG